MDAVWLCDDTVASPTFRPLSLTNLLLYLTTFWITEKDGASVGQGSRTHDCFWCCTLSEMFRFPSSSEFFSLIAKMDRGVTVV